MELLSNILGENAATYVEIFSLILTGLITIASAIVRLTKSPRDDEILAGVKKFLKRFSILNHKDE